MQLYVRHQAWLSACPDDSNKTKDKRNRFVRISSKNENDPLLNFPEIDGGEYLINLLHEVGPVGSNGYGMEGLKWSEIQSWLALTGLFLCPWEIILIKELSDVFASEFNKSNGKECAPPYQTIVKEALPTKEELNDKFARIFNSMNVVDTRRK